MRNEKDTVIYRGELIVAHDILVECVNNLSDHEYEKELNDNGMVLQAQYLSGKVDALDWVLQMDETNIEKVYTLTEAQLEKLLTKIDNVFQRHIHKQYPEYKQSIRDSVKTFIQKCE